MNWAVGDIHGKLESLQSLVELVKKRDPSAKFHFTGDYVDRGENSKGVVDFIIGMGDSATCVRGNHDDVFDTVINGPSPYAEDGTPVEQLLWFSRQGMLETLESYKIPHNVLNGFYVAPNVKQQERALEDIRACIPDEHKQFFKNLPLSNEQDDFFVAHAYMPHHVEDNIAEWLKNKPAFQKEALWGRFATIAVVSSKRWKKTGFFGHSPTMLYREIGSDKPIIGPKIRLIDTGCCFNNRLTAYCVEDDSFIQVDPFGAEWKL